MRQFFLALSFVTGSCRSGGATGGIVVPPVQRADVTDSVRAVEYAIPPSVEMLADLVYASPDGQPLRLDLFRPKAALTPSPAVIFIHGGRPDARNRAHYHRLAADVAARGLVTATIDYRQPLNAPFPAAIEDARAAIRWMNDNAKQYGVLPGAVAATGEYFGGYIAAMLGVARNREQPEVGAVVGIHAVLDLPRFEPIGEPAYAYAFHAFLGYPRAQRPELWEQASPLHYVNSRSAPFLLAHVEGQRIPIEQSQAMMTALETAGVRAELISPEGMGTALVDAPHKVPGLARSIANFVISSLWKPPDGVRMIGDVVYASPEGRDLRLDLFLPASATTPSPGVLLFHGGGWAWGDKKVLREQCVYLAQRGFVTACVEYRLARERIYPAALDDAKAAVRWMRASAPLYRIDQDRIAALGLSAGGHLAAMLGVTPERRYFERGDDHPGVCSNVAAVVAISAVVDVRGFDRLDPWSTRIFMGGPPQKASEKWAEASPTNHVGPGSAPFLFLHATNDGDVAYSEAAIMRKKLEDAGVLAEMFTAEDGGHPFFFDYRWRVTAMERIENFLGRTLKSRRPATADCTT